MKINNKNIFSCLLVIFILVLALSSVAATVETDSTSSDVSDETATLLYLQYNSYYDLSDEVLEAKTAEDMISALQKQDIWASYMTAEQYKQVSLNVSGDIIGIGVQMEEQSGKVVIIGTVVGASAAKAGLKKDDIIVKVDGTSTEGMTSAEVKQLLTGELYTQVEVTVERNGRQITKKINRVRVETQSVGSLMLEDDIGYLRIYQFTDHTYDQVKSEVTALQKSGMKKLVLDLRDCPGGVVNSAVDVCGLLAATGPEAFVVTRSGYRSFYVADEDIETIDIPLAVLINGSTASAAEFLAADIQDENVGVLIGEQSYGKGFIQHMVKLPSGAGIKFTIAKYISRGYQDIDESGGVMPDLYLTDKDAQLAKSISYLKDVKADPQRISVFIGKANVAAIGVWSTLPGVSFLQGGKSYAAAASLLSAFGWEVSYADGCIYCYDGQNRLIIDTAAKKVIGGGTTADIIVKYGIAYLPLSFLRKLDYTVNWDSTGQVVRIYSN